MTPPRQVNYAHITEASHAQNRVHAKIQQAIQDGTLTPELLAEIRDTYWDEVRHLDVPAHGLDSVDITVSALGNCTEEDIKVWLALSHMPEHDEMERRVTEAKKELGIE